MNAGYLVDWNKNSELYHIYKEKKCGDARNKLNTLQFVNAEHLAYEINI